MIEHFFGLTDTGRQRSNNEDAFVARALPSGRLLLAVIDGVGGYEGGEVAAAIARAALEGAAGSLDGTASLQALFGKIQEEILAAKAADPRLAQMACVLTAVLVDEKAAQLHYAHVGDTRMYLYRDGSLVKLTQDQSFVGLLEDSGRISEAEAMAHPKRNEIDKALGFGGPIDTAQYVEGGSSPFLPGDGLLLCSDGLSDLVTRAEMTAMLDGAASLEAAARALIAAANERGGKDNITVVLARSRATRKAAAPVGQPRPVEIQRPAPAPVATPALTRQEPRRKPFWPWLALGLSLLILLGWWLRKAGKAPDAPVPVNSPAAPTFAENLALARDTVRLAGDSVFLQPDSLFIGQDSLLLLGAPGTVLRPDSGQTTWLVAPTVRRLALSRLEIRDADIQVSSSNVDAIRFDSVRLVNVRVGVAQPLQFRDTVLSGVLYAAPQKGGKHE